MVLRRAIALGLSGLLLGLSGVDAAAAAPAVAVPASVGSKPATAPNPQVPDECGISITVVLDASGSVDDNNQDVRDAARAFLDALKDTGSSGRVVDFASQARETAPMSLITSASLTAGGVHDLALNSYYQFGSSGGSGGNAPHRSYSRGDPTQERAYGGQRSGSRQYTNWQEALEQSAGDGTKLVVLITDGDPTAVTSNGRSNGTMPEPFPRSGVHLLGTRSGFKTYALYKAINAANDLKDGGSGPRILAVGVGDALQSGSSQQRLKDISGPDVYTGRGDFVLNRDDVALVREFRELARALRSVATELCSPSVTITKLAQSAASAQFAAAAGWDVTVEPSVPTGSYTWTQPDRGDGPGPKTVTTNANGQAQFQWEPSGRITSTAAISEAAQIGWTFDRAECRRLDQGLPSNEPPFVDGLATFAQSDFAIPVGPDAIVSCKYYNAFDYQPGIAVTKVAVDDPVRGNAAGWNQTYVFTVTNTGNAPLSNVRPIDPQCQTISGPSGDTNGDSRLDVSETWTYHCGAFIQQPTTNQPISRTNTVTVTGIDPPGTVVTDTATVTVGIKTPAVAIEKSAKTSDGTVIGVGGTVPAGSRVGYEYRVTNPGNDILRSVTVTDDRCSPVTRISGTGTLLAPGAEWIYSCSQLLQPPSTESTVTNTGTVTANWSGWTPTGQNNTPVTARSQKTVGVKKAATITVVKAVTPGAGSQEFDFTVAGAGVAGPDQSFSLNPGDPAAPTPSRAIVVEPAGGSSSYQIAEAATAGWQLTGLQCVDDDGNDVGTVAVGSGLAEVTLAVGDAVTCAYTNERLPRLSVVKLTSSSGATDEFGFTASRPAPLPPLSPAAFTLRGGASQAYQSLPIGPVTIQESALPAGWALNQIDCGGHPLTVNGTTAELDLGYGDNVVCIFVNGELAPATLTVAKKGTTVAASPDFAFTAAGIGLATPGTPGSTGFDLAIGDTQQLTVRPDAAGSTYTVTEALPAPGPGESGWSWSSIECVLDSAPDSPVSGDLDSGAVDIDLAPGQHATCTYVNEQLPRLTIRKSVSVAEGQFGADQTFDFAGTGPGMSAATLGDGESQRYANLTPGAAVSVAEDAVSGWTLTGLACSGPGAQRLTVDRTAREVSGALALGDDVTCTFANTREPSQPATLTVIKQVEPAGSAPDFDFSLTGTRVPADDQSFQLTPGAGGTDSRVVTLAPDDAGSSYTLTESALPSGWDSASLSCQVGGAPAGTVTGSSVSLDLLPGDAAACTYVNKPQAALTIAKKVSVAQGQTGADTEFDFTTTGLGGATARLGDGEGRRFTSIAAGTALSVTETAVDGWSSTVSCTGTGAERYTVTGAEVAGTAQPGDAVTCTYVNTKDPTEGATLTVVKKVSPAGAGPSFPFDLSAANPDPAAGPFALQPGAAGTSSQTFTLSPFEASTTYTVTETVPTGWELTSLACTVNGVAAGTPDIGAGAVSLALNPGDAATCTYINEPQAQFAVVKQVSVGTGQAGADQTFAFFQTGLSDFGPLGHGDAATFAELPSGTAVSVQEAAVAGWSTQVACTGPGSDRVAVDGAGAQLDVQAGDDITCTYVNTKDPLVPAVLAVGKLADPAAGAPDFAFTVGGIGLNQVGQPDQVQFSLTHDDVAVLTVHPAEAGDDYTVTEAGLAGWNRSFIGCTVSSDPNTVIAGDLGNGTVTVPGLLPGEVAVCLYGNQQPGSLTVAKHTNTASQTQFTFAADRDPTAFSLGDGEVQTFAGLEPGTTVEVTESVPGGPQAVPERWTLVDITCVGAAASPVIDLAAGRVAIEVGAGEDVTCTYSDAQVQPATITVTKSASPAAGESFAFTASGDDGGVLPADQSFDLAPDGGPASRTLTVYPGVAGETYTITEALTGSQPFEWRLESIACQSAGSDVGTVSGESVALQLQPGESASCTFANRENARLTVLKSAPENPDLFFPFSWSIDSDPFELADQSLVGVFPITAGSYWVDENVGDPSFPVDWYLAGGNPVCTGTAAEPDYSRPNGANLTIADGESAWCTFTNRFDYRPDIQLVKDVDRTEVLAGGEATYRYDLTNTGNVDVEPADGDVDGIVVDDKCAPVERVTGSGTVLAPGETWVYRCTSTGITNNVTNVAKATVVDPKKPEQPLTSKDTKTVTVLRPGLSLTKIADAPAVYGGTAVGYAYEVANTGAVPIRPDAPRASWVADDQCSPVAYGGGDTNNDGILDPGEVWTYSCTAVLSATTTNVATVTGTPFVPPSIPTGPEQVGPPIPITARQTVEVVTPGIAIVKNVDSPNGIDPGRFAPGVDWAVPSGETVTFTYQVTSGAATTPMQIVSVADDVCAPLVYQSGDSNADGLLDLDETWTYTCDQLFVGAVTVTNTVVVTGREPKVGGAVTDTDRKTVQSYIADITVAKAASEPTIAAGDTVTFTYRVSNPGPEPLRAIDVADDRCAPLLYESGDTGDDGIMFPDEIWVYTCSQTLQSNAINVATVTGRTPGTTTPKNSTSTHVGVITKQDTGITVEKSAAPTTVAKGGEVTYTYRVTATKVPLAEVKERITDDTCGPVTYVSGDDDGNNLLTTREYGEFEEEAWVFTCTTTVDRTTTNTVTATGVPKVGNRVVGPPVTDTDTATVTVPGTTTPDTGASVIGMALLGLLLVGGGLLLVRRG